MTWWAWLAVGLVAFLGVHAQQQAANPGLPDGFQGFGGGAGGGDTTSPSTPSASAYGAQGALVGRSAATGEALASAGYIGTKTPSATGSSSSGGGYYSGYLTYTGPASAPVAQPIAVPAGGYQTYTAAPTSTKPGVF